MDRQDHRYSKPYTWEGVAGLWRVRSLREIVKRLKEIGPAQHGGWCPKGKRSVEGLIPARYALTETPSASYLQRTEWNVRDSDGTVVFTIASEASGGSLRTIDFASKSQTVRTSWALSTSEPAAPQATESLPASEGCKPSRPNPRPHRRDCHAERNFEWKPTHRSDSPAPGGPEARDGGHERANVPTGDNRPPKDREARSQAASAQRVQFKNRTENAR